MQKIIFFVENNWAFGSIHNGVCKEFFLKGINSDILDWRKTYSLEEFKLIDKSCSHIITVPCGVYTLLNAGIDPKKLIVIAHEEEDVCEMFSNFGEFIDLFGQYAVISDHLINFSISINSNRIPKRVKCGIHFDYFYKKIRENLKTIGYAGAKASFNRFGIDRKRGYLLDKALERIDGINLYEHKFYNFLCMPGYYSSIDGLVLCSSQEACGLPVLEAAASGRLVIGSNIGYLKEYGDEAGIILPIEEDLFVERLVEELNFYKSDSNAYKNKCKDIQEFARNNYDWKFTINTWMELLE